MDTSQRIKTVDHWMKLRRKFEGAEGIWRIHDKLYDFSDWQKFHPGGEDWLEITKGTDITEAFETHHLTTLPESLLAKYVVADASTKRFYDYTFEDTGFYRTLKKKIRKKFNNKTTPASLKSITIMDSLAFISMLLCILTAKRDSYYVGSVAGFMLAMTGICSHNFVHMKNNWRMYYMHFVLYSVRDWRISHSLSHHLYTNTSQDLEIRLFEPFFYWLPLPDKSWISRRLFWIYAPAIYSLASASQVIKRLLTRTYSKHDLLILIIPALMLTLGTNELGKVLYHWAWIISVASFVFVFIGLSAGHHHPESYHEGDAIRKDRDWGLLQLDAVRDRIEFTRSPVMSLITFGDHCLHHLFPTLDHSCLSFIYDEFEETCEEFHVKFNVTTVLDATLGQYKQLMRNKPNPVPPQ